MSRPSFAKAVRIQQWEGVVDIVPAYASVTIHVDPFRLPHLLLCSMIFPPMERTPVRSDSPRPRVVWR